MLISGKLSVIEDAVKTNAFNYEQSIRRIEEKIKNFKTSEDIKIIIGILQELF